jgi:hypothetical protein
MGGETGGVHRELKSHRGPERPWGPEPHYHASNR